MFTRNNNEIELKFRGYLEPTTGCSGPILSSLNGIDKQCCVKCHNIRVCYYRNAIMTDDKINLEYIKKLKMIKDIDTAFAISTCGSRNILSYQFSKTELSYSLYRKLLLEQFVLLHRMGIVINDINEENFSVTNFGIPIVFPAFNYELKNKYGGDTGIQISVIDGKKYFTITSASDMINSGKWMFLYNYYKSFTIITDKTLDRFQFYKRVGNEEYFEIPRELKDADYEIVPETVQNDDLSMDLIKIKGDINDKYVILDLDNTLIHSVSYDPESPPAENDRSFYIKLISVKTFFHVTVRKHVKKFLHELIKYGFKLIVWSAGGQKYVKDITSVVFKNIPLSYVFTSQHVNDDNYKDISIIGNYIENFNIDNCRLVDDNILHRKFQEKNFIPVKPYFCDKNDDDFLENFSLTVKNSFV